MTTQQAQARQLYFNTSKSQKEIADEINVSEKTIYNWIREFSWHKQREEEQNLYAVFASSMCDQLLQLQAAIAARPAEERCPTAQEINLQCKLLNIILKLKKQPAKNDGANAIATFLLHVADEDAALGALLQHKYETFSSSPDKNSRAVVSHHTPQDQAQSLVGLPTKPLTTSGSNISVKSGNDQKQNFHESAPITPHDFKDYKHLLGTLGAIKDDHRIRFRGRFVNARWLEYNLLQYCLPVSEQRFIGDAARVIKDIDHADTKAGIARYLAQQVGVAA